MSLPEVFDAIMDGFIGWIINRSNAISVGIFGSWNRYEICSKKLDVLIVSQPGVEYEYNEIIEYRGRIFDLNFVPIKMVGDIVSPEMDHRLYEMIIYHDSRDLMSRAKTFVERCYRTKGRVEVRTEGYLATADLYMSRAASALTRGDIESSVVYGETALTPIAHLLIDVAGYSLNQGELIWGLRRACERLRLMNLFDEYLDITRLSDDTTWYIRGLLDVYKKVWSTASSRIKDDSYFTVGVPWRMRRDVEYLTNPLLYNMIDKRVSNLLNEGNVVGAKVYLRGWVLPLLEACAWFVAGDRGDKFDYTSLFRELTKLETVYNGAREIFSLGNIDRENARIFLSRVRDLIGRVRGNRRALINSYIIKL